MLKNAPKQHLNVKAASSFFNQRRITQAFSGLRRFNSIVVAVSGGGDSMALLLMLKQHLGENQTLTAVTINHQLRAGAASEAVKVKSWCKILGVAHKTLNWKHDEITSSFQAKARAARYNLLAQHCAKYRIEALLTAHTLEDQAETVAMRMARTASPKSLAAIWPESKRDGYTLIRPLLSFRRAELREFLIAQNQLWIEDPSNSDLRFERARLRAEGVDPALAKTAHTSQRLMVAAIAKAKYWAQQHSRQDASSMVQFYCETLLSLPVQAQDEALVYLIASVGGKAPELAKRISMLEWLQNQNELRRSFAGTIFARRKNMIYVGREPSRINADTAALSPTAPLLWDNRYQAVGPKGSTIVLKSALKQLKRIKTLPAFVDAGLPIIVLNGKLLATPFESHHPKAKLNLAYK